VSEPATFRFADIAGFTALTEAHGDAIMLRIPDPAEAIRFGLRIVSWRHRGPALERDGDCDYFGATVNVAARVAALAAAASLPVDPVCRMAVGPDRAAGRLIHAGAACRFCSLTFAVAFASDPGASSRRPGSDRGGRKAVTPGLLEAPRAWTRTSNPPVNRRFDGETASDCCAAKAHKHKKQRFGLGRCRTT
jgi:YHS domain-containing protein